MICFITPKHKKVLKETVRSFRAVYGDRYAIVENQAKSQIVVDKNTLFLKKCPLFEKILQNCATKPGSRPPLRIEGNKFLCDNADLSEKTEIEPSIWIMEPESYLPDSPPATIQLKGMDTFNFHQGWDDYHRVYHQGHVRPAETIQGSPLMIRWEVGPNTNEYYKVVKQSVIAMAKSIPADLLICHHDLSTKQYEEIRDIGIDTYEYEGCCPRLNPDGHEFVITGPAIFNKASFLFEFQNHNAVLINTTRGHIIDSGFPYPTAINDLAYGLPPGLKVEQPIKTCLLNHPYHQKMNCFTINQDGHSISSTDLLTEGNKKWWIKAMNKGISFTDVSENHWGWRFYKIWRKT